MLPPAVSALFSALVVGVPAAVVVLKILCFLCLLPAAVLRKNILLLLKITGFFPGCSAFSRFCFMFSRAVLFPELPGLVSAAFSFSALPPVLLFP